MFKYQLWSYDVWGNKKDGFEVNNRYRDCIVEIPEDAIDREIIKIIKKAMGLKRGFPYAYFEVDGEPEYTLYVNYTSSTFGGWYPVCELEYLREEGA